MIYRPLPMSVVPEAFASPIGVLCLNFQRIEDELDCARSDAERSCFDEIDYPDESFSRKESLTKQCLLSNFPDDAVHIELLFQRIEDVRRFRNDVVHSRVIAGIQPGHEILVQNRKDTNRGTFSICIDDIYCFANRANLIVNALELRREGLTEWSTPLKFWERPDEYFLTDDL